MAAPSSAWAWTKAGHMVTGAIVYEVMKQEHPAVLTRVVELLRKHPQFDEMFAPKLEKLEPESHDRALLMWAARWADDIRDNPEYDQPKWHYIDFPFKPKGQPDSVGTAEPDSVNLRVMMLYLLRLA